MHDVERKGHSVGFLVADPFGTSNLPRHASRRSKVMAPKSMKTMKAMKAAKGAKAMTKSAMLQAIADQTQLKRSDASKAIDAFTTLATAQVKKVGKFTVPGLCMIKTRVRPATKAGKREMFGKVVVVKARPAKTVVKAYCVAALKKAI